MREHENTSVRLVGIRTPTPTRLLRNWVHNRPLPKRLSWEISTVLVFKWPSWTYKPKSRDVQWVFAYQTFPLSTLYISKNTISLRFLA